MACRRRCRRVCTNIQGAGRPRRPSSPLSLHPPTPSYYYKVRKNHEASNRPYSPLRPRNTPCPTKSKCQTREDTNYFPKFEISDKFIFPAEMSELMRIFAQLPTRSYVVRYPRPVQRSWIGAATGLRVYSLLTVKTGRGVGELYSQNPNPL